MKFRIRELTPGYRLEVCVPTLRFADARATTVQVGETWIPYGHPYGSIRAAKSVAEELGSGGQIVEEFDVEPVAATA